MTNKDNEQSFFIKHFCQLGDNAVNIRIILSVAKHRSKERNKFHLKLMFNKSCCFSFCNANEFVSVKLRNKNSIDDEKIVQYPHFRICIFFCNADSTIKYRIANVDESWIG